MIDLLQFGYLGIFLVSLALNLLPFTSPSNLILAGTIGVAFPQISPIVTGFLVAFAASIAKLVHFYIAFFVKKTLRPSSELLANYQKKSDKIKAIILFLAAISPVPDEPVVIPLGLMEYNPIKFFIVFFSGKIIITTTGAFIGSTVSLTLENVIGNPMLIILSIVFTIIVTYVFMKVDVNEYAQRVRGKVRGRKQNT
ncbi:MAG: VTT domain-containing protein [Candidatus Bathyarchaeota archaeon]|nr:MAG: VTT domain-containing protein [Candidatus Bathyarchaeota archaeon]